MSKVSRSTALLRVRDLEGRGLSRVAIGRMVARGELVRVGRGLYREADAPIGEHHDLAVVAASVPKGVVCLLSAASFHELGSHVPHEIWVALPPRTWTPTIKHPPLRVVRFSGARYGDGVESHVIEGVKVGIHSIAKTVVDLFRYRNKLGLDVALEALREARTDHRCSLDEITRLAARSGVLTPMRPHLESLA